MIARHESGPSAPGAGRARAHSPRVSVIVPVLDEEARIGRQLERLASLEGLHEIIARGGDRSRRLP